MKEIKELVEKINLFKQMGCIVDYEENTVKDSTEDIDTEETIITLTFDFENPPEDERKAYRAFCEILNEFDYMKCRIHGTFNKKDNWDFSPRFQNLPDWKDTGRGRFSGKLEIVSTAGWWSEPVDWKCHEAFSREMEKIIN